MKFLRVFATGLCAVVFGAFGLTAIDRTAPPRLASPAGAALIGPERQAVIAWAEAQPEVRAVLEGRRTRLLQVGSNLVKSDGGVHRTVTLIWRDYEAGMARQATADLATGGITLRDVVGVQPSTEEIEEARAIIRRDPALAKLASDPRLELLGGFHNSSTRRDDPCAREICLDFAFLKPDYGGPARYVIVNLTRGVVAHHDFRIRPGEAPPRMTERAGR